MTIAGEDGPHGAYDPSIEYGTDGIGWMSYSSVTLGRDGQVETRIARSDDHGASWVRVADVNRPTPATVELPNGRTTRGAWWHEVSTLVHDATDRGREWKLYWHRYVARVPHRGPKDRLFAAGWIATRHAPSPLGPWSDEVALFGAGDYPLPPFRTKFKLGELSPELSKYIVLTEPGSLSHAGRLYLTLQAVRLVSRRQVAHDILLLASDDHGETWRYVSTPLPAESAEAFGADFFTGSSLATERGRVFLMVCPQKAGRPGTEHRGTVIFEFDDIARGTLKRSSDGKPTTILRIEPQLAMGGQADYDEANTHGGIVFPQFDRSHLPRALRIFNLGRRIVN